VAKNIAEHPSGQTDPSVHEYLNKLGDQAWHRRYGIDDHPLTILRHKEFPGYHVRVTENAPNNTDAEQITNDALAPKRITGKSEAVLSHHDGHVLLNPSSEAMYYQYQVLCDPRNPEDKDKARRCLLRNDQMLIGLPMDLYMEVFKVQSQKVNTTKFGDNYLREDSDESKRVVIDA
jgi:hypothetical protein